MRALISVYNKDGIEDFAKELNLLGVEIISTGGTARRLESVGLNPKKVSSLTQFPEIMDGRVKTLHPFIHGGLLARREDPEHMKTVEELKIPLIDIVVVNLYPFEATVADPSSSWADIVEKIDIGGPSMVRSAAKNYRDVIVLVNPGRYSDVINQLKSTGTVDIKLREQLAVEAFSHTARYDAVISTYFRNKFFGPDDLPEELTFGLQKHQTLRYGENSHQQAALYRLGLPSGLVNIKQLQGKELSFNNYIDTQAAYQIVKQFDEITAVVIKHTNPCGVAMGNTLAEAYVKALEADSTSAYGGIIGLNRECDAETAQEISKIFVEVVIAPSYSKEALNIFSKKKNLRILIKENFYEPMEGFDLKRVAGGILVQHEDTGGVSEKDITVSTEEKPSDQELKDMLFGWKIIKYVKSNAICLIKEGVMVGVGAGQMSRIEAMELAVKRAGDKVEGSVMVSDAYFPFRDCVDLAAKVGVTAVIQPGGSIRDDESIVACNEHGLSMVFTGMRHFRH